MTDAIGICTCDKLSLHKNQRLGAMPFYLQFGVEPVLLFTSVANSPVSQVELAEAAEYRRQHVLKYETDAAGPRGPSNIVR